LALSLPLPTSLLAKSTSYGIQRHFIHSVLDFPIVQIRGKAPKSEPKQKYLKSAKPKLQRSVVVIACFLIILIFFKNIGSRKNE